METWTENLAQTKTKLANDFEITIEQQWIRDGSQLTEGGPSGFDIFATA